MRAEILEKITGNTSLTKVNLANMKITDDEILETIKTIQQLKPNASKIDLDNNNIGDKGAMILSQYLRNFPIKILCIQFNNIGRKGAVELFRLKKDFSNLDILFHGNKITNVREMAEIESLALRNLP